MHVSHHKTQGILQTAQAKASNTDFDSPASVRILLDSGSQLSYITPSTRERLHLPTMNKASVIIKSFGEKKRKENFSQS